MIKPFEGSYPITAPFGYSEAYGPTYHEGVDYGTPTGTQLIASQSGEVVFAGYDRYGAGYAVSIQNGQYISKTFHMSRVDVKLGQKVTQGQNIGLSGNTGNSTGPHVHWQVEKNFVPINPLTQITPPKEDDMIDQNQLNVIYRMYLGRKTDPSATKTFVGKKTFEETQKAVRGSAEYKRKQEASKSGKLIASEHLPDSLRTIYKPPASGGTATLLKPGLYEVK